MADKVQTPESGGGEGAPPVPAQPDSESVKPASESVKPASESVKPASESVKPASEPVKPATSAEQSTTAAVVKTEETEPVKPVEVNQEKEVKAEPTEVKVEQPSLQNQQGDATQDNAAKVEANGVSDNAKVNELGDWQQRESDLLKKIEQLEKVNVERTQDSLVLELKVREEEIDLLKARVKNLETELQAALSKPSGKNHEMIENIKRQHEELLSKARGMIFDKTKMVKNQELQIEALTTQIQSLKDINQITKDLLEIRNSEVKAMEDRLQAMEARFKVEKERYGLVLQRAQTSTNINDDLRKEYETQLALFKELREKYDLRVQALVAENERLKGLTNPPASGAGTSG